MARYNDNDILALAKFIAASNYGVTLNEIMEEFEISRRTAERWRDRVNEIYPLSTVKNEFDRKLRYVIPVKLKADLMKFATPDIYALESIKKDYEAKNDEDKVEAISTIIQKIKTAQKQDWISEENDIASLLEREGYSVRQYPHFEIDKTILGKIRNAILASKKVKISYIKKDGNTVERIIHPYGILHNIKMYLVGFNETVSKNDTPKIDEDINSFIISKIENLEILEDYFDVPDNFDFQEWANKSFGIFQGDEMNVKLKFTDTAIEDAKNYHFHPTQKVTEQKDCVIVEFKSCGAEAICWELFKWGTAVEILEPAELKERYVDKLNSILEKNTKN